MPLKKGAFFMSEPTVEANFGNVECNSYYPGHNVHWIPVLRKWVDEPRLEMTIRHIEGNSFELTSQGTSEILYNHAPSSLIKAIETADPSRFKKVGNTGAITITTTTGHAWIYFSKEPFIDCETPRPDYYEPYRYIDAEIARLEALATELPTMEQRLGAKERSLKAQHIKQLQETNKHQKIVTISGYQTVCSCGLLLDNIRRIDEEAGHITY